MIEAIVEPANFVVNQLAAQSPMLSAYIDTAQNMWRNSRHPENLADMRQALSETPTEIGRTDKAILAGTAALIGVQMSPLNEVILGRTGGAAIEHFGNVFATFGALVGTVAVIDGAIVTGTSHALEKARPAMDIVHRRYLNAEAADTTQEKATSSSRIKRALGKFGLAFATGGAGVVTWLDYKNEGQSFKENVKDAAPATAMLAAAVGGIGLLGHSVGAAGEAAGHPGVTEGVIDFFKVAVPVAFVSVFTGKYAFGRYSLRKKVDAQMASESAVQYDDNQLIGLTKTTA